MASWVAYFIEALENHGLAMVRQGSVVFYLALQVESTVELLELAYGCARLFNNPLEF